MAFLAATLLGAPGAGKGTYAKKLIELLRVPHVSSGDIFRAQIEVLNGTLRAAGISDLCRLMAHALTTTGDFMYKRATVC